MKTVLFIAAAAMGTAAAAQTADPGPTTTEQSPDTEETSNYDGPDSYNPNQPPPTESGITRSVAGPYQPVTRDDYPRCSETVRDNCIQTAPPA